VLGLETALATTCRDIMPTYNLRLLPPPEPPPPVSLRAQTLPCEGRWWWAESPSEEILCLDEDGLCEVTVSSPFSGGVWVRGFFVYDTTGIEGEPYYTSSVSSNVISHGCSQDAPPQPVPEPAGLLLGALLLAAIGARFK